MIPSSMPMPRFSTASTSTTGTAAAFTALTFLRAMVAFSVVLVAGGLRRRAVAELDLAVDDVQPAERELLVGVDALDDRLALVAGGVVDREAVARLDVRRRRVVGDVDRHEATGDVRHGARERRHGHALEEALRLRDVDEQPEAALLLVQTLDLDLLGAGRLGHL